MRALLPPLLLLLAREPGPGDAQPSHHRPPPPPHPHSPPQRQPPVQRAPPPPPLPPHRPLQEYPLLQPPPQHDYVDYSYSQPDLYDSTGQGEWRMDSVECYDCHARIGTCNEGSCSGKACVKIEASVNERKSVTKGCTQLLEEPSCVRTDMVGVEALRCVCAYDHCNADEELARAGLVDGTASRASAVSSYPERPKRTQPSSEGRMSGLAPNYLVMLVFLSLFLTASFSLLIFNTVCVHLC